MQQANRLARPVHVHYSAVYTHHHLAAWTPACLRVEPALPACNALPHVVARCGVGTLHWLGWAAARTSCAHTALRPP